MRSRDRQYIDFDPSRGWPTGPDLSYECTICGDVLPSLPEDGVGCSCRNIFIDVDAGKMAVKNEAKVKLFKE